MKHLRRALMLPLAAAALWVAGFAWFLHAISTVPPAPPRADGIVALTGGAGRLEEAFRLLGEGRAPLLLVSGVGDAASPWVLARRLGSGPAGLPERVTLGRAARSTLGNARESADWARAHGMHSVIVVTASYHMPRALLEMRRAMPGVALLPAPVTPPALRDAQAPLGLLAGEYTKLLGAWLGLAAVFEKAHAS